MFDKSNPNYKLYLAGVISESQYMDLCELVDAFSPAMNPTGKTLAEKPAPTDAPPELAKDISKEELEPFKKMLQTPIKLLLKKLKDARYEGPRAKQFLTSFIHTLSDELDVNQAQMQAITRNSYK